ncbi:hypothetical protein [Agromyces aureus]|uniref:Uncharacterized protein n=1 Tax=Agromyces aureus TaxID=453304 RepID=A0A191WI99_9MICO|nr:hypothetical protein [Agromyces aureus]ANJ27893.1 hypothetical protein ATC03_15390 [Agromyces aureus]
MSDATTAAVDCAKAMTLTRSDSASGIMRLIQDAALKRIDPVRAEEIRAVDVRFDRVVRELRLEQRTDVPASDDTPGPSTQRRLVDVLGTFLAAGAVVTAVDAGRQSGSWTQAPGVLAPLAAGLLILAVIAHAVNSVLGRRPGNSAAESRFLLLVSGAFALVVVIALPVRAAMGTTIDFLEPAVAIAIVMLIAVLALWWARRGDTARAKPAVEQGVSEAPNASDAASRIRLEKKAASAEVNAHLDELSATDRAAFDAAVDRGVREVLSRGTLGPQAVRALRSRDRVAVRYAISW